jgi:prepilin peptidase CpaA
MGHRAVRNDPTPDGDVQIGVGIVQHRAAVAGDEGIDAKAKDQRQGEAVTAAAKCQGRADSHIAAPRDGIDHFSIRLFVVATKAARNPFLPLPQAASVSREERNPVIASLTTRRAGWAGTAHGMDCMSLQLHLVPLAGFAGLMLIAAVEDLRRLVIPNAVVLALGVLWPLQLAAAPTISLTGSAVAALCAASVFGAGALLFSRGLMGGGDVKLLTAATLWAGPGLTPALLIVTAILGGLLTLALLFPLALRAVFAPAAAADAAKRVPVPYGVAIAAAALVVTIPPNLS